MARQFESFVRQHNPEEVLGLDQQKVKDAVATITHRVGQKGKSTMTITVEVDSLLGTREVRDLRYRLRNHHNLTVVDVLPMGSTTKVTVERKKNI
jgi:hypothetical protein